MMSYLPFTFSPGCCSRAIFSEWLIITRHAKRHRLASSFFSHTFFAHTRTHTPLSMSGNQRDDRTGWTVIGSFLSVTGSAMLYSAYRDAAKRKFVQQTPWTNVADLE